MKRVHNNCTISTRCQGGTHGSDIEWTYAVVLAAGISIVPVVPVTPMSARDAVPKAMLYCTVSAACNIGEDASA